MTDNETQSPYMDEYRKMPAANGSFTTTTAAASYTWNGPWCPTCNSHYLGSHECSITDLQRRIDYLQKAIDRLQAQAPKQIGFDSSKCPCSPANGGSGICNCTLGGPTIIC